MIPAIARVLITTIAIYVIFRELNNTLKARNHSIEKKTVLLEDVFI
jgi:ABC-type nickel/cobalt efflux system permease component RcnA